MTFKEMEVFFFWRSESSVKLKHHGIFNLKYHRGPDHVVRYRNVKLAELVIEAMQSFKNHVGHSRLVKTYLEKHRSTCLNKNWAKNNCERVYCRSIATAIRRL